MIEVSIPEMMEAGGHFGHQTKRWNPKMRQYIYGAKSGVHIIDLQRTKQLANEALKIVTDTVAQGKDVLFVGTKPQAREIIKECAVRVKQHYVNQRWMGGTLTNFKTIKNSIDKLIDFEKKRETNAFEGFNKRELLEVDRTIIKLEASLGGIKLLKGAPSLVFIVDPSHEHIAVLESRKLGIPIMAITDTNCDPELIDYIIPGNDDAILSITYFTNKVAEACLAGLALREQIIRQEPPSAADKQDKAVRRIRVTDKDDLGDKDSKVKTAYVGKIAKTEFEGEVGNVFSAKVDVEQVQEPTITIDPKKEPEKLKKESDNIVIIKETEIKEATG
ncbi:MAG: 30S ribosomal protein S2 [Deltaproteobacteria bacterium]|nr:30S ribosomal protein S2 [Deltaproteobacteria bacterium]